MKIEIYLEIGESNFAYENSKNSTELINTEFAMQKMYAKWYHVFLEDSNGLGPWTGSSVPETARPSELAVYDNLPVPLIFPLDLSLDLSNRGYYT